MVVSTLLTLFVVPAGYSVLDDVIEWFAARIDAKRAARPTGGEQ